MHIYVLVLSLKGFNNNTLAKSILRVQVISTNTICTKTNQDFLGKWLIPGLEQRNVNEP